MAQGIGLWIDHKKAVLVKVYPDGRAETQILESHLDEKFDPVKRPSVKGGSKGGLAYQFIGKQLSTHAVRRWENYLKSYYRDVIANIKGADSILVMGPSQAKKELLAQMGSLKRFDAKTIDVKAAPHLTQPQIVAKVKRHFGIKVPRKLSNREL